MPTIDQLLPVVVASDDDVLPVSQSGIVRRVTRSQLLAGTQSSLALTPGLLGRVSAGLGSPEPVSIGSGLLFANGVLSGSPRYTPSTLPVSGNVGQGDLVPVSQNSGDHAVSVRTLLSSGGVDVSTQLSRAAVGITRQLGDWVGDAVAVEAFGAIGDGITNDTAAFNEAIASGRPVVLGPKTYRIDGQWTIQSSAVLYGIRGITTLRRIFQSGGAWINILGPRFVAANIVFDAGSVGGDSWGVLVAPSCLQTDFENCSFLNATGAKLGTGLTVQARDGLIGHGSAHRITGCTFQGNTCHGLWVQATAGADVRGCLAANNGAYGICLDYNDPSFSQTVRQGSVVDCRCLNNSRGISIGNYNATNLEPPQWGLANPDATDIVVSTNVCSGNTAYGIAVSGARIQVLQNRVIIEDGLGRPSGILCNASLSTIDSNIVVGPGQYGIDAGGSTDLTISNNLIESCAVGVNAGGGNRNRLVSNTLVGNQRAVTIFQVETDGHGLNFGLACSDIWIEQNVIQIEQGAGGIFLFDGPARVDIRRNRFIAASPDDVANLCWAHSNSACISGNILNGSETAIAAVRMVGGMTMLVVPDILDAVIVPQSIASVDVISGLRQASMVGVVSFIQVVSGGTGYSIATVVISGSGAGAAASAYVSNGAVIGIALAAGGSGYDTATTAVTIVGDGKGASARPFVGLQPGPERRLVVHCLNTTSFSNSAAAGQTNWTFSDVIIPANTNVVWEGTANGWQATQFNAIDHLFPGADGSLLVRSKAGGITLHPEPGGSVRFSSDAEPAGFLTCFGRGSPEGVITAPPGSDYRNLDGGTGSTVWFKRVGNSSVGWFALA